MRTSRLLQLEVQVAAGAVGLGAGRRISEGDEQILHGTWFEGIPGQLCVASGNVELERPDTPGFPRLPVGRDDLGSVRRVGIRQKPEALDAEALIGREVLQPGVVVALLVRNRALVRGAEELVLSAPERDDLFCERDLVMVLVVATVVVAVSAVAVVVAVSAVAVAVGVSAVAVAVGVSAVAVAVGVSAVAVVVVAALAAGLAALVASAVRGVAVYIVVFIGAVCTVATESGSVQAQAAASVFQRWSTGIGADRIRVRASSQSAFQAT